MTVRMLPSIAMLIFGLSLSCQAEECDAILAKLRTQIPALSVVEKRTDDNQSLIVSLKHPDAEALTITCAADEANASPQISAKWNATWPPSRFYDLLASVGAVVVANTEPAIRSGAILCTQRAMNEQGHAVYDVNGARFRCISSAGVDGSTVVIISKLESGAQQ